MPSHKTADRRAPKFFRPQKSSIAGVRLRSVLNVREDGSRTGSAIFVAKKRRKQPHVSQTPRTQTDNSCVQRPRTSQTPRKLPPRTTRTYKIPNASPEGMHQHEQHKNIPNKNKQPLIPKRYKLPTTLNTTAKDKAQNAAQQRLIKNAVRRILHTKAPSEARAIRHNSAVKSRGTRDERAGASPIGGPLTRLVVTAFIALNTLRTFPETLARRGPPQAPALVTPGNVSPNSL